MQLTPHFGEKKKKDYSSPRGRKLALEAEKKKWGDKVRKKEGKERAAVR